ncbi:MAG: NTP transferase domain-containing protein [Candidatus Lokiarchaeota archaeon]|nr:NTP transferase domain-containing protein [Candidatus Lokiarchaeota archaeon]MBD3341395.1 NTP transferase domain-containing protein [Candidatus Lokiarchaeota archaeon]
MTQISEKRNNLAFAILVGGRSSRFGTDKGLYPLFGKPIIQHQLEIIYSFKKDIFINAHSNDQIMNYKSILTNSDQLNFILDQNKISPNNNIRSPMIGFYSIFKELLAQNYTKVFTISCDMPLINPEVIKFMIEQSKGYDCCIPIWNNGYLEPLFAIYRIEKAIEPTYKNIKTKTYKLINILKDNWKMRYISIENELALLDKDLITFVNLNVVNDVKKLETQHRFFYKNKE